MLDQPTSVLAKSKEELNGFGQSIALTLKSIFDKRAKEFIKYKIREFLFQAQFGHLAIPLNVAQNHGQQVSPIQKICAPHTNADKAQYLYNHPWLFMYLISIIKADTTTFLQAETITVKPILIRRRIFNSL